MYRWLVAGMILAVNLAMLAFLIWMASLGAWKGAVGMGLLVALINLHGYLRYRSGRDQFVDDGRFP
jgi:hypothetical protein